MTMRLSSYPEVMAAVSMHPSHSPIMSMLGEDEEQILRMVVSKQLMMTSRTDSPNVVPGRLSEEILGGRLEMVQFDEMDHGWTTRGHI